MPKHRSRLEWLNLITECRKSGLTDHDWCEQNGINPSGFYKAVRRLRAAACVIPESSFPTNTYDLTAQVKQDVVPVKIIPDDDDLDALEFSSSKPSVYSMTITCKNITVQITNDANPELIEHALRVLGGIV